MTEAEFTNNMTILGIAFGKDFTESELGIYYKFLKVYTTQVFGEAIQKIILSTSYVPKVKDMMKYCEMEEISYELSILQKMLNEGYFKKGAYGELSDEQAERNYEKALNWISTRIIPQWFKEDMILYGYKEAIGYKPNMLLLNEQC